MKDYSWREDPDYQQKVFEKHKSEDLRKARQDAKEKKSYWE